MKLYINGQSKELFLTYNTLHSVLENLNLSPKGRIIEHNGKLILPEQFKKQKIKNFDQIEIIQFMGGG